MAFESEEGWDQKGKIKGRPGKLLVDAVVQCQTAAPGKIP